MKIHSIIRPETYILKAASKAGALLNDRKALAALLVSASSKIESGGSRIASVKNDIGTLVELLKAWIKGEYREVPWNTLLIGTGAVIYFVNPLDAIPDILPAAGLLDDASVIGFVLASAKNDIEKFRKHKANTASQVDPD
ncbi:MAG TPA: YkvA family protein [Thermodesulfobacteriota bacterium]|nr:YkvA family protein [Thermodesulfobacteriota bacterium]